MKKSALISLCVTVSGGVGIVSCHSTSGRSDSHNRVEPIADQSGANPQSLSLDDQDFYEWRVAVKAEFGEILGMDRTSEHYLVAARTPARELVLLFKGPPNSFDLEWPLPFVVSATEDLVDDGVGDIGRSSDAVARRVRYDPRLVGSVGTITPVRDTFHGRIRVCVTPRPTNSGQAQQEPICMDVHWD